jgi:prepilin-type N-terminal cleavage/methylation domain-containing protein/prepilin-type processing-associated H-X9-DG protein
MCVSRRGFTLIELLVVIAIITILTAILFPVFATARAKARQATCQSNLKQIGMGILQYTQDFDEVMPYAANHADCGTSTANYCQNGLPAIFGTLDIWWPQTVGPYIAKIVTNGYNGGTFGDQTVFVCPEVPTTYAGYFNPISDYTPNDSTGTNSLNGYGIMAVADANFGSQPQMPMPISHIQRPSEIIAIAEQWRTLNQIPEVVPKPFWNGPQVGEYDFHNGGSNSLYVDGHVKWNTDINMRNDVGDMWGWYSL